MKVNEDGSVATFKVPSSLKKDFYQYLKKPKSIWALGDVGSELISWTSAISFRLDIYDFQGAAVGCTIFSRPLARGLKPHPKTLRYHFWRYEKLFVEPGVLHN